VKLRLPRGCQGLSVPSSAGATIGKPNAIGGQAITIAAFAADAPERILHALVCAGRETRA